MPTVTLSEAQARLPELIAALVPGEQLRITENDRIVAVLSPVRSPAPSPRQAGSAKDKIVAMSADFDATPEDFTEYLQ